MEERRSNLTSMIGMMLMAIVLLFFFYRNQPTQEQPKNNTTENTQPQQPNNATVPPTTIPTDSVGLSKYKETLGAFAYSATLPSAKEGAVTELENSLLKLQVSNKGGQITSLQVKNQKTYNGQPVELIKDKNASFSLELSTADNRTLRTEDLFFEPSLSGNVLSMKLRVSATQYLEYVYTLRPDEYFLDMTVRSVGLSSVFNTSKAPELTWKLKARRMEKSVTYEDRYVQAVVQYEDNRNDKLSAGGEDSGELGGEGAPGAHGADRVGGGGSDADAQQVEDTERPGGRSGCDLPGQESGGCADEVGRSRGPRGGGVRGRAAVSRSTASAGALASVLAVMAESCRADPASAHRPRIAESGSSAGHPMPSTARLPRRWDLRDCESADRSCSNMTTFNLMRSATMTTTMSSREFNQNVSLAKRASSRGPVLITDRGVPSHVLLSIKDYRRLTTGSKTLVEALSLPGLSEIDFDVEPTRDLPRAAELN